MSEVRQSDDSDEVSEIDDEISEAGMMSEKRHETDDDELDEISDL